MKTNLQTKTVIVATVCASLFALAHAFSFTAQPEKNMQTVTVAAHRMSDAEKLAYDREQLPQQTVVISAKRLTEEQKISFDEHENLDREFVATNNTHADAI